MCDVSGSMSAYTGPAASAGWILARAAASIPAAQTATVTYGEHVAPVTHPATLPPTSPSSTPATATRNSPPRSTPWTARSACPARLLVVISDGYYKDTQYPDGQKQITRLTASGCGVLWIAPDTLAKPMKDTQVITLDDPAATADTIARAATRALT
jgi:uncharacterized protein with von Willebrand factor type A (vWA) domain